MYTFRFALISVVCSIENMYDQTGQTTCKTDQYYGQWKRLSMAQQFVMASLPPQQVLVFSAIKLSSICYVNVSRKICLIVVPSVYFKTEHFPYSKIKPNAFNQIKIYLIFNN